MAILEENLVEILLGIVLTFNMGAYKFLWDRLKDIDNSTQKNSEAIEMVFNRIFGIDEDPTDEGYFHNTEERIQNTEQKVDKLDDKVETIATKQEQNIKERKEEHKEVYQILESISRSLSEQDNLDIEHEDLK